MTSLLTLLGATGGIAVLALMAAVPFLLDMSLPLSLPHPGPGG